MNFSIQTITPEIAKAYLKTNENNFRALDTRRVELYAKDIRANRWELNGAPIIFGRDGKLIDGQHRLAAVVKTGISIETAVLTGASDNRLTLDRGKPRNVAQFLKNEYRLSNETKIAAQARLVLQHNIGGWVKGYDAHTSARFQITDQEIIDFVGDNQAKFKETGRINCPLVSGSVLGALMYIGSPGLYSNCETAKWFVKALNGKIDPEELNEREPVRHLRHYFLKSIEKNYGRKLSPNVQKALLTVVWNATVEGETFRTFRPKFTGPGALKCPAEVLTCERTVLDN